MKEKEYIYKFNLVTANIFSIVIFILLILFTAFLLSISSSSLTGREEFNFFLPLMLGYLCLHEFLHGLGYIIGGAKPKNVYYGIALEKGILYCLCRQEISKKGILISLQMPFMVIGVITYIIGMLTSNMMLVTLSICNLVGASMDMAMFNYIARLKDVRYSETDANDEFVLITKEDLTKRKSIFLTLKEVKPYNKNDFEFKRIKRITISKISWVFIIILLLISLLPFIMEFI